MRKFTIFINVCVLFFLITYFFLSRWYLLLFVRFSSCVYHVLTESFLVIRCKKRDHSQKNYQSRITLTFMGNIYVVVNFLSQVIFIFLLFLGMLMYANEV